MMRISFAALVLTLVALTGHSQENKGFRFPGGSADQGKVAFEKLGCIQCHSVKDTELKKPESKRVLNLSLGKEIRFVKKYEDIITAITNPQHVVDTQYAEFLAEMGAKGSVEAYMPNLIDDMSARQLMDLVTFLDSVYRNLEGYKTPGSVTLDE